MITQKSLTLAAVLAFFAGIAVASTPGTNTMEHTFCVNSKTKVVTYAKSGKCPKGNEAIQVGAIGPQGPQGVPGDVGPSGPTGQTGPQGEAAKTSFNLLLRDGSGKLVEDLVGDGSVYKDGRFWNLNYENGKFTPLLSYFYTGFFDSTCKTDPVAILFAKVPTSAEKELQQLQSSSIYNLFLHSRGGVQTLETFYEILPDAKIVDNRDISAGTEMHQISLKRPVYSVFDQFDTCALNNEAFFYIEGVAEKSLLIPEPLPTPIRWSRN